MNWYKVKNIQEEKFRRLIGIKKNTFDEMVKVLEASSSLSNHKHKGKKRGPKPKLITQDQVLVMLMYYREYRTFFHTAYSFGISESQCWRIVTNTEKVLIKSGLFTVPGKKVLLSEDEIEGIVIDATESEVERPQKNKNNTIQAKRKNIPTKVK